MMKTINIYFQAVTKVSVAHITVEDDEDIEDYIKKWDATGYAVANYMSESVKVYIPWTNIVYCQYSS